MVVVGWLGLQIGMSFDFDMSTFLDERVPRGMLLLSHAHICMGMVL